MVNFSERYGYKKEKTIQFESVNEALRNRIWNLFYVSDIQKGGLSSKRVTKAFAGEPAIEDLILDKLGFNLSISGFKMEHSKLKTLQEHLQKCAWNEVYEFAEAHIASLNKEDQLVRAEEYNKLLEVEKSGYQFIGIELIPITNKSEIAIIESATTTIHNSVNQHIRKALAFYSDIESPDYENSVKESISAVEAMCCIITETSGVNTTLGKALKRLENSGVHIHPSMKNAFSALYGYTSDESGIRHGGIDFKNVPAEDAKFMLVTCSAFVNYLIEKWSKINSTIETQKNEIADQDV